MKKLRSILLKALFPILLAGLLLLIGVTGFFWYNAALGAAFSAKTLASGVFVAGRTPESLRKEELGFVPWLSYEVDYEGKTVTAWIFPKHKHTAVYREGLGVALAHGNGGEVEAIRGQARPGLIPEIASMTDLSWPTGDAPSGNPPPAGFDAEKLEAAVNRAFHESNPMRKIRTRAVVVCYKGEIVAERYAEGFGRESRFAAWSMSKSVLHAMYGVAVKDGVLSPSDSKLLPDWAVDSDPRGEITIDMLLRMSSGLAFDEYDVSPSSNLMRMIYLEPAAGEFAASLPLEFPVGTVFAYSSGTSNILSLILRRAYGDEAYYRLPYEKLFSKIGMRGAIIEADASGTFVGSSFVFAAARDYARFGLLYMNDGVWNGERVLPEGWVEYARTPTPVAHNGEYGAHWKLPTREERATSQARGVPLPEDTFYASGIEGQKIVVIPSRELVIVRLGLVYFSLYPFFEHVCDFLEAFPE